MSEATITSLIRAATKTEPDFYRVTNDMLAAGDTARLAEYFDKMNIPRSAGGVEDFNLSEHPIEGSINAVENFAAEIAVSQGIQKFIERHLRKLKWHWTHPSMVGISNATRLYRAMSTATTIRIERVLALLGTKDSLTVGEWGSARELLNRAYRDHRVATEIMTSRWPDALLVTEDRETVLESLKSLPTEVSDSLETIQTLREGVEARRVQMEVLPEGYPPVRPPRYFGGDLLDGSSWRHFWGELGGMSDHIRNTLGQ